ncbi:SHOCT domain-containing protein [Lacticaseibacillus jixiensis]|uniref:SHOCT domain-containing protein n=1 Tax=Lacticaseibacillus jixiensis TaxID=3231926 RepID=UPI0036F2FBA0
MAKLHICLVGGEEIHPFKSNTGHVVTAEGDWICSKHWKELGFTGFLDAGRYGGKITNAQIAEIQATGANGQDYMKGAGQSSSIEPTQEFSKNYEVAPYLSADTNAKIARIASGTFAMKPNISFAYDDLLSYKVVEDGDTISKTTDNGVGRAIGGGLVFGPVGALVGVLTKKSKTKSKSFVTDLHIDVTLKNHEKPLYKITLIGSKTKPGMILNASRKSATEIAAFFDTIIADNQASEVSGPTASSTDAPAEQSTADQLRDLKALLDEGIINQDDFDAKKKQILGL